MREAGAKRRSLGQRAFKLVYLAYYRWLFGRRFPGAGRLARAVREFELRTGRGDVPVPRERWEAEYAGGGWEFMRDLDELPRYAVIAATVHALRPGGAVLDVGCGEGILRDHLRPFGYRRYVGVDLSEEAVRRGAAVVDPHAEFVAADAERWQPQGRFDTIVFNESLYYFEDPLGAVARYRGALAPDGLLVASMFRSRRADVIARRLGAAYALLGETAVGNRRGTWVVRIFR